jgi:DNA-binding CsgD family transcriptional regulator
MLKRSGTSHSTPYSCDRTTIREVERLRHADAVHQEALLLDRSLVYEVLFDNDAFSYISPHAEQLTGFTLAQWRCEGAYSAMMARCHPEDLPTLQSSMERLLLYESPATKPIADILYRWQDNFGRWRWCNDRFCVLFDDFARPLRMIGCFREVTEQVGVSEVRRLWLTSNGSDGRRQAGHIEGDPDLLASMLDTGGLGLTRIQRCVLELILVGLSNKQIAHRLLRSIRTIEDHRYRIMRKLGAENAVDLVRKVLDRRNRETPGR